MIDKPKKRPKGKKTTRQTAVNRADKAFSEYIRARDRRCVICGTTDNLTCGHVFSRAHYATRWDELNAFAQCVGHNLRHEHDPYPLIQHAEWIHGKRRIEDVHERFIQPTKLATSEILGIEAYYKAKLKELEK